MHGKDKVIAPLLVQALGVKIIVPENFDTDKYGILAAKLNARPIRLKQRGSKPRPRVKLISVTWQSPVKVPSALILHFSLYRQTMRL
jgi:hypothetical protein